MCATLFGQSFAGGEIFRRRQPCHEHPHYLAHTLSYLLGPIAATNSDGGEHGGTAERLDSETLALAVIA